MFYELGRRLLFGYIMLWDGTRGRLMSTWGRIFLSTWGRIFFVKVLVNRCEVAGLVLSVIVISGKEYLVPKHPCRALGTTINETVRPAGY